MTGGGLILALRKSACGTAVIDLENYFGRLLGAVFSDLRGRVAVLSKLPSLEYIQT